ncbi:hypothetical protein QJS04_geneDACA001871 [Acorus gramineus]|uniref:Uncharacterized protein n=1 Tax=Acorus gramineus TaxID=55184 RepID=A0AAV9BIV5_ACOGR|nr:hypothetical protein QJS04_geneDACA001871 [Acorus gramineus]
MSLQWYWEVLVRRNLHDDEVDDYFRILEMLHEMVLNTGRSDKAVWTPKPAEGFSGRSCYAWERRSRPQTSACQRKQRGGPMFLMSLLRTSSDA